jgi:hypothetical protein
MHIPPTLLRAGHSGKVFAAQSSNSSRGCLEVCCLDGRSIKLASLIWQFSYPA